MRTDTIKKAEMENKKADRKVKSPFVSFFVTSTAVVCMLASLFTFVMFKTDGFFAVDEVAIKPLHPASTYSVDTLRQLAATTPATSGPSTGGPTFQPSGNELTITWPFKDLYWLNDGGQAVTHETNVDKYYGLGLMMTNQRYLTYHFSYDCKTMRDAIQSKIDPSNCFATVDGRPLTAFPQYWPNITGSVVRVTYENGDVVEYAVIDAKATSDTYPANPNASCWTTDTTFSTNPTENVVGHYYIADGGIAITECICDRCDAAAFNAQFGTNLSKREKPVKVELSSERYIN